MFKNVRIFAHPDSIVVLELKISQMSDEIEKELEMDFIRNNKHMIVYVQPCKYG